MTETTQGRQAILILGMHRSGTSAITRVLSLLGASLPRNVSGKSRGNEKGHWEPLRLVELNDRMLADAESCWDDWRSFEQGALLPDQWHQYERLIANAIDHEYAGVTLPVIKDPRVCRFVPLYERALESLGIEPLFVIPHRNPLAVIESLVTRDQMTRPFAALLWLRHTLDAELASRDKPRVFIGYEEFLQNWRGTVDRVVAILSVTLPSTDQQHEKEIEGYLSKDLQHHTASLLDLANNKALPDWIYHTYQACLSLTEDPNDLEALGQLDAIRTEFQAAHAQIVGDASMREMFARLQHCARELTEERTQRANLNDAIATLKDQTVQLQAAHDAQRTALQNELTEERTQRANLNAALATLKDEHQRVLSAYLAVMASHEREKFTVFRPIYRHCYRRGGKFLRRLAPENLVPKIRMLFPHPDVITTPVLNAWPPVDTPAELHIAPPTTLADIFVFSIIDWDFRYQRPQQIANSLSAARRVFYIEMSLAPGGPQVRKLSESLYVVRLPSADIGHLPSYTGRPSPDQIRAWLHHFYAFCDAAAATSFKHVVLQHPFWWQFARHLPPEFQTIFDCMDDIAGFSNTQKWLIDLENEMIREGDRLIVSSQYLFDKYKHPNSPIIIRNGCEIDHFLDAENTSGAPPFLTEKGFSKRKGKIYAGYVGAIAEWFDAALLSAVATANPDIEFHLCGAVTSSEAARLAALPNVTMYGEIPYTEVPGFITQMDVLTIPFQLQPLIHACDPVKFYEYSAVGKPTVSTNLPELKRAEGLVFFASTVMEFAEQIHAAHKRGADPAFQESLREYAANNTWDHRAARFEEVLFDFPKVSVVILSYGEPHWTLAALQSLHEGGAHYPNLEVLVVDNGSPPHWLTDIHNAARSYPEVTVIENGENLGFARGNNVGLAAATGDYILLLNNDTYVAPGAVHAMVRHLQRNPEIGAVGPLTNNIGNEAKLAVEYQDMQQMKLAAREAVTGHRGKFTPLRVLAYFSVMFRRADLDRFGLLSEEYGRGMFEDDDHCAAIRSHGYLCALAEDAFVHHHLSATFSTLDASVRTELFNRNKETFEKKWGKWIPHVYRHRRPLSSLTK